MIVFKHTYVAIELSEAHPEVDPQWIRFTDLHAW
ncbi:Fe-S cluster assembly protein IscX, partial [Acinetobacter baumannii]